MDKLDKIFELQKQLDERIERDHNVKFTRDEWIQKEMLAIISELSEALSETNFKWWKVPKEVDDDALREELIDVLHFFISLCIRCGLSADSMFEIYTAKNRENIKRQDGTSDKKGYKAD